MPSTSLNDVQALRSAILAALEANDRPKALNLAEEYWRRSPDASVARFIKGLFDKLWPSGPRATHKLAILRSATLEPVVPLLEAEAALAGCRIDIWMGPFNGYAQSVLNRDSDLYAFKPDTIILALFARDVTPRLWAAFPDLPTDEVSREVDAAIDLVKNLLGQLRNNTTARLICHGLEQPAVASAGVLDTFAEQGQRDAIEAVNRGLRDWCRAQSDTYILDYDSLAARYGRQTWFDERKWSTTRLPLSTMAMSRLATEWWRYLAPHVLPQAKVLALDLDNTVWGGVLGEDGLDGVRVGGDGVGQAFANFQRAVLDIAKRGILITLVSKNNEADVFELLNNHPDILIRPDHLAAWRVNWEPKTQNIVGLAEELGVGLESFVFIDDSPAECDAIRRALPDVEVVELPSDPYAYADLLRGIARLERFSLQSEDADRGRYYVDERQRRELMNSIESVEDFLASLQIEVAVEEVDAQTLGRAAQLTQKTNQLNMTTRRYSEAELEAVLSSADWRAVVVRSKDRFGDNGIVGLAITKFEGRTCMIDTFLMSCRVIGRGIEGALLHHVARLARERGASRLEGWFLPTKKNAPAADIYRRVGMTTEDAADGPQLWRMDISEAAPSPPSWIVMPDPVDLRRRFAS